MIQADGGTRAASIRWRCSGSRAVRSIPAGDALVGFVSSVSVGIYQGTPVLDLDYAEDSNAETDMNVVRLGEGFIELQGTGEAAPFTKTELASLIELAEKGTEELLQLQQTALAEYSLGN